MNFKIIVLSTLLLAVAPQQAQARKVYSPHADAGEIELETQTDYIRATQPATHGKIKQQIELAVGISEWWHSGIYAVYEKPDNRSAFRYTATKWENIFVFPQLALLPLQWGLYLEYENTAPATQNRNLIEGKLLLEGSGGMWTHTLNITLKKELGVNAPAPSLGYAWRSRHAWPTLALALEAYGNFGAVNQFLPLKKQSHLLGPVISGKLWDRLEIETGWLIDLNAGSNGGDFKLNLEYAF